MKDGVCVGDKGGWGVVCLDGEGMMEGRCGDVWGGWSG